MTDAYNPFGSAFVDPALTARLTETPMSASTSAAPPRAPTELPDLRWETVKARRGWGTAVPEDRQRIHTDYANVILPWLAQQHGGDPAQWTQQFLQDVPTPTDAGDFRRGMQTYWPGTQAALYGLGALGADLVGADDTAGEWAMRAQGLLDRQAQDARPSDSLSGAWKTGEGITGTLGNLANWAQFNLGQMLPSVLESLAFSVAGAAAGSGAAPGPGTIAGAIGGVVGKKLVREEVQAQIANMAADYVAKQVAQGATEEIAKREALGLMRDQLAKESMRSLGAAGALATAATARGMGESYNAAFATEQDGGPDVDVGRVLAGGAIYGAAETFGDALLADTLLRGVRGTEFKDRVAASFARNAVSEGATEAVQEGATRFAGQQSLTDAEALTAYFDSAAAGGLGGGVFGGIAAIRERPQPQGDAAFLQAMDTLASDRQANPTPSTPYRPTLQLPAPVVAVTPDGMAMTAGQQDTAMRADAALVREREAMGLTPDVNAARMQHPAAVPNAGRQPAPYRPLALPEPVVTVTPGGVAVPAALRDAMDREATAFARERASLGLTPDVNAARARHPGAVPNEGVPPPTPVVTRTPAPARPTSKTSAAESSDPVPKGVVLNTTTPEGEALLGFREKRGNGKVRVRRSDWESDRSYLPLFDPKGQPIPGGNLHRRLLVDAQPLPASESVVQDTAPPPANPSMASPDDSPVSDASDGLDRPALRSVFVEAMARKLPNVTDRESGFYAKSADELIDLIERRDARGLLGRNLGDAKANPASRALFTAATGVILPRGRGATEDAIYRWAGTDRATEQAREAERRAQREAEVRAPVEAFPAFASYAEAKQWAAQRSRAFGGQQAYRATEEYGRLQPILQRLADQMNDGNRARRLSVLTAAGLAIGDRVQATSRDLVRGVPQTVQGTLFAKSGFPWVRVDDGQTITVSHEGRIEHRRELPWSDRWTKLAEPATESSPPSQAQSAEGASQDAENAKTLMAFVDDLIAQAESGRPGRVEFPADFRHVTEVESALRAIRRAFEQAGAVNSGGRSGARYAIDGGTITVSNSANRLWADIDVDRTAPADTQPLPADATAAQNDDPDTEESSPLTPDAAPTATEDTDPDAGTLQTERLPARSAREAAGDVVADRAGDREPLDAGLAQAGAATDRGELLPEGAGGPDRAGREGEDGYVAEPPVELGEGAGAGAVAGAPELGLRGRGRRRGERRARVNEEAAAIDDPAASSVVADQTPPRAQEDGAPATDEGLADDLGKGGLARKARDNLAAIRIVQALAAENRVATPDERKQLARYVGWGALKGVFDPANAQWAKVRTELQGLLSDAQWRAARASVLNAHYTSKPVIDGMYAGLARLGVTRGRILEPAVGIGHFFGGMLARLRNASELFGIELDPLTQQIAAALYPKAKIRQSGFQDAVIPGEFFDVAIGNPPFGSEPIVDAERSPYSGYSIHNYFFAKSIDKLRPGGVLMMVVSHQFLDAKDSRARQWIAERADLIGAARLPRTAFAENAGTEVVTDIIVLQKRAHDAAPETDEEAQARMRWVQTTEQTLEHPKTGEALTFRITPWFLDHPEHVLGTPSASGSMYRANEYTVEPSGDLAQQLQAWAGQLPQGIYAPIDRTEAASAAEIPDGVKVGAYFLGSDGRILIRDADRMGEGQVTVWTPPTATAEARMRGMIELREVLRRQMRLERSADAASTDIEANRRVLNDRYDAFIKRFGHLNASRTNRSLFIDDPDASLLLALEFDYDAGVSETVAKREGSAPRAPKATKADIFRRRVLFPPSDYVTVSSARDALVASLNYRGRLDPAYMAEIYGKDRAAIVAELGGLVFETPDGDLVTADDYLSGDVKTKLVEAKAVAKSDPRYARNVEALTKVIPRDKTPSEITIALGAPFLPVDDLRSFHREVTGADAALTYVRGSGLWLSRLLGEPDPVLNTSTWGTKEMSAAEIFQATLAGRAVVVTKTIRHSDGRIETRVLEAETERAREKQTALRAEWRAWVWRDPERAERLLALYNEKMNRIVERRYDGSHLTLPGMSPGLTLLKHQQDGIWRGLQSRQLLLDHVVGAGKTFQMVGIAMEMRRLGIARKPLFAVPNHLTIQWRTEFARLYPGAVVLAAEPDDFSRENRKKLFSRIVTGDWDAIIVGHSSLKKIGLPEETETRILTEQIDEIASLIEQIKRERGDRGIVREMEGIRARLEAKIKAKLASIGARDTVLTFDELGVDALFVDELHEFKNLFYTTTMSKVPGMGNPNGSDRAFDLFVKTQWLFETFGDKAPIVTATGTPVSNSLVEMFNLQRFMQYPTLQRQDLHVFDAWARQYGSIENVYEVAPSGAGFRASTRFAKFQNLPALMANYRAFADVVTLDDLKAQEAAKGKRFPVPKLLGGKPQIVVAERSPLVAEFMGVPHLTRSEAGGVVFGFNPNEGERATIEQAEDGRYQLKIEMPGQAHPRSFGFYPTREDAEMAAVEAALTPKIDIAQDSILGQFGRIRELTRQTKGRVNALSLTGQANKAGLDFRLIDPAAPDFPGSKLNLALERMLALYRQWEADKGTQLVFCDLSVPNSARKAAATTAQRVYLRESDGSLTHAKGTAHTVAGAEELPFVLVARKQQGRASVAVYDAATGHLRRAGLANRNAALSWARDALRDPAGRERWLAQREAEREAGQELSQAEIDDYNDANAIDTESGEGLSLQDIAGLSAAENFSVYDDLRAKLIAGGVPQNEIAFIHDYPNPEAKAKLFKRVNRGEIRFLFGSTPKMGAGTNVQERIVGLHHIDAPWKPSDLEQREGRAIRRDNKLYERDPDGFEVAIYRYATRQTYDTRRWQLLEHKARGIAQLRKYDGQQTEIEDIDGEAANAAEMKAAASGDPLILRETQLRHEVRRLEQLELAHADNQTALQRQARTAEQYAATGGPRHLKALREVDAQARRNPMPEDKEAVPGATTLDGKRFGERKALTQAIARQVGALIGPAEQAVPVDLVYRGVAFEIDRVHAQWVRVSSGLGEVTGYERGAETFSATGLLTRLNNYLDRIGAEIVDTEARIETSRRDAERFKAEAGKPFDRVQDLREAREQYRRVQRLLLVRGPEIPDKERPILDAALEAQRSALREAGLGHALDELLDYQNLRDDGTGSFSKRSGAAGRGASVAQVRRVVDEMMVGWKGAPVVRVVDTPDHLPASARRASDYHLAEGYYERRTGTVYLVASALPTRQAVQRVLAHEAIGHYGIEAIAGPALWAEIAAGVQRLREKGRHARLFAEHAQRGYADNGWDDTAVREFIAMMAESGVKDSLLDRLIAAVRVFLRKLGVRWRLSEAELRQLIARAVRQVRIGGTAVQAAPVGARTAVAFSRAEGFRSALLQALERAEGAPRRGTATQWHEWLDGVQRRGGFKQAERDWLQVDLWLSTREAMTGEPRITREALTEFVRTHQVRIAEELKGGDARRFDEALSRLQAAGFEIEGDEYFGVALLRDGETVDPKTLTKAQRADLETVEAGLDADAPLASGSTIYTGSQLEGGREYRELLLTLPPQPSSRNPDDPYVSSHFPAAKNLLLHVRYNEREDVKGRPMLFIEEIQSDWHQDGRKYGYGDDPNSVPQAPFARSEDWSLLALKRMVRMAVAQGIDQVAWTTGDQQASRNGLIGEREAGMRAFYDRILPAAANRWAKPFGAKVTTAQIRPRFRFPAVEVHALGITPAMRAAVEEGLPLFSKRAPDAVIDDLDAILNPDPAQTSVKARAKAWLKDITVAKLTDATRSAWLGLLTTRHLGELGGDYFEHIRFYNDYLARMSADRNQMQSEADTIAEDARRWVSKHRAQARDLFRLMHAATIAGVDPAKAYAPLQFRFGGKLHEVTPKSIREALKALRQQMRERSGDSKVDMMQEAKILRGMPAREKRRRAAYPELVARWNALPKEAQDIYVAFRDAYARRSDEVEEALVARMRDTDAAATHKRRLEQVIRLQFERNRLQGVYFPLQRFGRYFVSALRDGVPVFLMFERLNDLERAVAGLKAQGYTIRAQGLKAESGLKDAPKGTFVAEIIEHLSKAGVSEKTQEEIYQLYLQALPEMSMRKHQIHRNAVPGFDPDGVRAFAWNMHHGSHQLARLRYAHKLQSVLDLLKDQQDLDRRKGDTDTRKIVAGDAILGELKKRHEWIMQPTDSPLTQAISSAGFVYYLGLAPASALVNLSQTALISYPYLAARFGAVPAFNALLSAGRDAGRTLGHIERRLPNKEEEDAYKAIVAAGAIDRTQAHSLAGIAEDGAARFNPAWAKAMRIIGWGFHTTELINREATGIAAFRLARKAGQSFDQAVRSAIDAIQDTHYDYTNQNRARWMQGNVAKVLLMFKQYSLNTTWHLGRMVWQATRNADPQTKRIARRNLAGVLGMSALFSGVLGLPTASMVMGILNAIAASFGDEDEPWEAETELRAFLVDMLGRDAAETLLNGPVNQITGADVASRVSLSQLWFRDADRELEGRGMYYHLLEQAAGPMGGVLKNVIAGKALIDEGHTLRGVETMLPSALKAMVKAARFEVQGANTLRGDVLVKGMSLRQTLLQLGGFTPAELAETYARNNAAKRYEQHLLKRRARLLDAYALATRTGDAEGRAEVGRQIREWNRKVPELAITPRTLARSMASRQAWSARAEAGIVLNPKVAERVREETGTAE
jgi:N12 class adenine-specific DNA methylase